MLYCVSYNTSVFFFFLKNPLFSFFKNNHFPLYIYYTCLEALVFDDFPEGKISKLCGLWTYVHKRLPVLMPALCNNMRVDNLCGREMFAKINYDSEIIHFSLFFS